MRLVQGDLVLLKGMDIHGIVIKTTSEQIFQGDKAEGLVSVLWHAGNSPRWVMSSTLTKVNV